MNPQTPPQIIHVVVWTSAILVTVFFGTLAAMQFMNLHPDDKVFEAFKMAGTSAMSFFFGMLVNTRVSKVDGTEVKSTEVTETKSAS